MCITADQRDLDQASHDSLDQYLATSFPIIHAKYGGAALYSCASATMCMSLVFLAQGCRAKRHVKDQTRTECAPHKTVSFYF